MVYDLIVIGAGSAGLACARRAASHGAKVAIIEKSNLGGTCVNWGCVPKKITFNLSMLMDSIHLASEYKTGLDSCEISGFEWERFKNLRDDYIRKLNDIYKDNLIRDKVDIFNGAAKLDAQNKKVHLDNRILEGMNIVIATGSHPIIPKDLPGYEHCSISDDFFKLTQEPKQVAIIGSGYIAVEMAGMFNTLKRLGSSDKVTIFCRQDRILTHFDREVGCFLQKQMQEEGINIVFNSNVKEIKELKDGKKMIIFEEDGQNSCFDYVMWAIGRGPSIVPSISSNKANEFELDGQGHYKVNNYQETSIRGIYAIGDVVGKFMLTPVAIQAGRLLADRLFNNGKNIVEYENIPSVIFSHPYPLASIGLSEEDARKRYPLVKVYKSTFYNLFEVPLKKKTATFCKLVCEGTNEKVVGLFMIGRGADEALQGFAVAIRMGATKSDFDKTVAIHPTASEEFISMR